MKWYKLSKNIENKYFNFIINMRKRIMDISVEVLCSSFKEYSIVVNTSERQFHIFTSKSKKQIQKVFEDIIHLLEYFVNLYKDKENPLICYVKD